MEFTFKRRLVNELLTTYLPTFILLLISMVTPYFDPFYFEAAGIWYLYKAQCPFVHVSILIDRGKLIFSSLLVTVNLTVMLVTTTIFASVMNKLPAASYVRLVDIWLIFSQAIPFLMVVFIIKLKLTISYHFIEGFVESSNWIFSREILHQQSWMADEHSNSSKITKQKRKSWI